jgi:hypothetical protein
MIKYFIVSIDEDWIDGYAETHGFNNDTRFEMSWNDTSPFFIQFNDYAHACEDLKNLFEGQCLYPSHFLQYPKLYSENLDIKKLDVEGYTKLMKFKGIYFTTLNNMLKFVEVLNKNNYIQLFGEVLFKT